MKSVMSVVRKVAFLSLGFMFASHALANIVITGTRVIYPAGDKEISVKVNNKGKGPVLIQSWIDDGDTNASPDTIRVPFIITPPMNRVDAAKGQTLRISYSGGKTLPSDRESVFWLNVLEIPPSNMKEADINKLQVAFRSRIKLFYRPTALKEDSTKAAESVKWEINGGQLTAVNNSPYYITLLGVRAENGKAEGSGDMVSPFGRLVIKNKSGRFSLGQKISWQYINDWGAIKKAETTL
ncbi:MULTISPECIES: fimbrial biogenesis chaperone [Klebsiella]|uniref:fimbrial biogenesis chaperone n=1 Tax=Klebsiella TaxID=570 RepID=UPI0012AB6A83|nr:fimbria/pilus periplasmic chaperone [Klebsiella oxytoca]